MNDGISVPNGESDPRDGLSPTAHDLGDGCTFSVGRLPKDLVWDAAAFDAAWRLHPTDKHRIMIHGRLVETPRWQQAYGEDYHYTGKINLALPVPEVLAPLLAWVQQAVYPQLDGILANFYEGPDHYIGPHHDSTKNMIKGAPIVTVSFGETRTFRLSREKPTKQVVDFPAAHGTVFVMPFQTNAAWKHSVPKSARYAGRRISVTFRAFESA